ncbi:hypothetical protein ES705_40691 [subsurface metagenome]
MTDVKKLYFDELPSILRDLRQYRHLDTERIVYRLYLGEGMVTLQIRKVIIPFCFEKIEERRKDGKN